jgi:integrase/recombinase XerD
MKLDRHGKATPINFTEYNRLRSGFYCRSHRLILDIAYYTGERWGAILRLQVSDVYSDPRSRVPHADITFRKETRKDNTTRQCPIAKALALRLQLYQPSDTGYLFRSIARENEHLSDRAADAAFRRAIVRSGLEGLGYSTHSTRRGLINRMHQGGTSLKVIQSITGHKSLSVLSGYIDVSDTQRRNAIEVA